MKIKKIGATDLATEFILDYIQTNNICNGDQLPSERELSTMIGVSRTSVRKAINILNYEGILYSKPSSGIFKTDRKVCIDLTNLRSFKEEMAYQNITYTTQVVSSQIIEANKNFTKIFNVHLGDSIYELIRLRKINNKPYLYQIVYLDYKRFKGIEKFDFNIESQYRVMREEYNVQILEGTERIGLTYATEFESKLLEVQEGTPTFYLSSHNQDEHGELTEYTKQIVRFDMISYLKEKSMENDKNE